MTAVTTPGLRDRDRRRHDRRAQPGRVRRRATAGRRRTASSPSTIPQPGWVEHDAAEIWDAVKATLDEVVDAVGADHVAAIGITNQRETVVAWDRTTGRAVRAARSSGRTGAPRHVAPSSRPQGHLDLVRARTGLVLDPYFSGTKFEWLLTEGGVRGLRRPRPRHDRRLAAVEPDRRRGARHRSDERQPHDAVRHRRATLGPRAVRPAPRAAVGAARRPAVERSLRRHLRSLRGRCPASPSAASPATSRRRCSARRASRRARRRTPTAPAASCCSTSATACPPPTEGMLTTVAWDAGRRHVAYALEGAIFVTGAAIQWLRDGIDIIDEAPPRPARSPPACPTAAACTSCPAFTGLG